MQNAALVSFADVSIDKIEPITGGRRLLADSIKVTTSVKASKDDADKMQSELLTAENINSELKKSGLPAATIIAITIVGTGDQDIREINVDADQASAPPTEDSDKMSAGTRTRHFLSLSLIGSSVGLTVASPSKTSLSLSILVMSAGHFYSSSAHYSSLAQLAALPTLTRCGVLPQTNTLLAGHLLSTPRAKVNVPPPTNECGPTMNLPTKVNVPAPCQVLLHR